MKKTKKKILAFVLAAAFIGYSLVGYNSFNAPTAFAHENIETQSQAIGCEQEAQGCEQEHTDDCSSCETNNHCNSDYLAIPVFKITFSENQNLLASKKSGKIKTLNYPPGFQPA